MSPTQNNNSDEIDLKDLFGHISKGIRDFIGKIIDLIALVRRVTIDNFKLFILIIAIFLLGSIGYDQGIKKDVFGSYMLVNSIYLNKQLVDNSVSKLNALAGELDKQTLAKVLNIDTGTAMLINGFEVEPFVTESEKLEIEILKEKLLNLKLDDEIIENIIAQIEIRNPNTFKITVFTETNEVVETLDSAINQYFLQNNYLKKRIEITGIETIAVPQYFLLSISKFSIASKNT